MFFLRIVAIIVGLTRLLYLIKSNIKSKIEKAISSGNTDLFLEKLEKPILLEIYTSRMRSVLKYLETNLGQPFNLKSNNFTTNLAVFYSFAVFFFIWFLTGSGTLGTVEVLDESMRDYIKILLFIVSVIITSLTYKLLSHRRFPEKYFKSKLIYYATVLVVLTPYLMISVLASGKWLQIYDYSIFLQTVSIVLFASTLSGAILFVTFRFASGSMIFGITFTTLVLGASARFNLFRFSQEPLQGLISILILFSAFFLLFFINNKWGASKVYFLNLVLVGAYFAVLGYSPDLLGVDYLSSTLIYFFVVMPFLNGIFDWISLNVSQLLATKILKKMNISTIISHILLDLSIAVLTLSLLVVVFIVMTKLYNIHFIKNDIYMIPIEKIVIATYSNPFSREGLWVIIMLASTIIPTAFHFLLSLGAFISRYPFNYIKKNIQTSIRESKDHLSYVDELAWYFTTVEAISILVTIIFSYVFVRIFARFISAYLFDLAKYTVSIL